LGYVYGQANWILKDVFMKLEDLSALIWVKKALTPAFNQKRCVVRMLPEVFGKLWGKPIQFLFFF